MEIVHKTNPPLVMDSYTVISGPPDLQIECKLFVINGNNRQLIAMIPFVRDGAKLPINVLHMKEKINICKSLNSSDYLSERTKKYLQCHNNNPANVNFEFLS